MQYVIVHDPDTRPALVIATCERITDVRILAFKQELFGRGCSHGLLIDADEVALLRDTFWTLAPEALVVDRRLPTKDVLARAQGKSLDERVQDWMSRMAASWRDALPDDQDVVGALLTDVVPALIGSSMRAAS